jgi:competence protein ComEC
LLDGTLLLRERFSRHCDGVRFFCLEKGNASALCWRRVGNGPVTSNALGQDAGSSPRSAQGRFLLFLSPFGGHREGDRLAVQGYAEPLERGNGSVDMRPFWWARGVRAVLRPYSVRNEGSPGASLAAWRSALRRRILLELPRRLRGYLLAAWLGGRDPELAERHRRWGTSHLLAVSGFHVGLVAALVWVLLGKRRLGMFLAGGLVWGYALLAGAGPSALRAAAMVQLFLTGAFLGRKAV